MVLAVVGSWLEPKAGAQVDFSDEKIPRSDMLTWDELKEMQNSGLVEIASSIVITCIAVFQAIRKATRKPPAVTRLYDPKTSSYEADAQYQQRITKI